MKNGSQVFCAVAALVLAGCASTSGSVAEDPGSPALEREAKPAPQSHVGRNAGQVAGACVMMLKAGWVGVPLMVACLPFVPAVALGTAVVEALPAPRARMNDGSGAPDFAYPGNPTSGTYVSGRGSSGFAYPNSYWGCYGGRCR